MVQVVDPRGDAAVERDRLEKAKTGYSQRLQVASSFNSPAIIENIYNTDVLAQEMLKGGNEAGMASLAKETDARGKALYAYLLQRQAEAKASSSVPKSSSAPLLGDRSIETSKALDKATALLTALKSGKTLLG